MAIQIVRLGVARALNEGVRIGAVRRPPRGVSKARYAKDNWFDVWLPDLAPSTDLMAKGKGADTTKAWESFARQFRSELNAPAARRLLDLLAALSAGANFSIGCYCENEARCHRSILRAALAERDATIE